MSETLRLCVVVSGVQPSLGLREVEAALERPVERLDDRIGTVEVQRDSLETVLAELFECVLVQEVLSVKAWCSNPPTYPGFYKELATKAEWFELANRDFAVTVRKLGGYPPASSVTLAAAVADGILERCKEARVNLERPEVRVRLIVSERAAVIGVLLLRPRGDRFRFRSKRYKVFKHPASLTPEDAKLLVNLSGRGGVLLDPFCGSGSIIVEACLSGLEAVGLDVDLKAAAGARRNLVFFSCDARGHVVVGDACLPPFRYKAFDKIATNPPYGRSARLHSAGGRCAYECLLDEGFKILKEGGRIAYIVPLSADRPMLDEKLFLLRVHGGLTRAFVTRVKERGGWCADSVLGNGFVDTYRR